MHCCIQEETMGETTTTHSAAMWSSTGPPISVIIRKAIAERTDSTRDCEPLYDAIDPDALDALFTPVDSSTNRDGAVSFSYCGYHVTVRSDRTVELTPLIDEDQ